MNYLQTKNQTPKETLDKLLNKLGCTVTDKKLCEWLDENDTLAHLRKEFDFPFVSKQDILGKYQ